jgi:hypothetical protein
MEVAGANRRWRLQFRCRGSRHESAVAQLFSLGDIEHTVKTKDDTVKLLADGLVANFSSHFSIFCGRCQKEEARMSPRHGSMQDSAVRQTAAERFYQTGWRYDSTALCPTCAKEIQGHEIIAA